MNVFNLIWWMFSAWLLTQVWHHTHWTVALAVTLMFLRTEIYAAVVRLTTKVVSHGLKTGTLKVTKG